MVGGQAVPDPDEAYDLADFIDALGRLRSWAGAPSYRELARSVGRLLPVPQPVAASTVVDVFRPKRRRLDFDLVVAIVRALGLPDDEADRWRRACVRVHGEAGAGGPDAVLRHLPADLATFTGRAREVNALIAAVPDTPGGAPTVVISAIEGMGGVGKTTLAVHVARRLVAAGRYAGIQLYANLRGFDPDHPPADPAELLGGFLRRLGVPPKQVPDGLDERAAMYRDRMSDRDALVLLDNAADEKQVRALIPASPRCLVLVTSRRSLTALDGAALFPLDVFSRDEGTALLARITGAGRVTAEPAAAGEVVELCGYLPLAVALAAGRLRSRPAWSLADLADALRGQAPDAIGSGSRTLRPVFDLSYRGLPGPAQRVLRLLGRHPGVDYTVPAVAAMADLPEPDAEALLELLQDEHLLQQKTYGRYELHDLLRSYAAEAAAREPGADGDAAVERLGRWFLHSAYNAAKAVDTPDLPFPTRPSEHGPATFDSYDEALAWFDREWHNLTAVQLAARDLGLHDTVWQLAVARKFVAALRNHLPDSAAGHELAVEAARALGDRAVEARVTGGLGLAYRMLGRLEDAERCYGAASAILRELGDWVRMGPLLLNIAGVHQFREDYPKALAVYEESLEVFEKSGAIGGRATARLSLGTVHQTLGDLDEAERYFLLALEDNRTVAAAVQADSTKVGNRRGLAILLGHLATVHAARGEAARAVGGYREQIELLRFLGDKQLLAEAVRSLGEAQLAAGDGTAAREAWTEALALFEDLGDGEQAAAVRERLGGG